MRGFRPNTQQLCETTAGPGGSASGVKRVSLRDWEGLTAEDLHPSADVEDGGRVEDEEEQHAADAQEHHDHG